MPAEIYDGEFLIGDLFFMAAAYLLVPTFRSQISR